MPVVRARIARFAFVAAMRSGSFSRIQTVMLRRAVSLGAGLAAVAAAAPRRRDGDQRRERRGHEQPADAHAAILAAGRTGTAQSACASWWRMRSRSSAKRSVS